MTFLKRIYDLKKFLLMRHLNFLNNLSHKFHSHLTLTMTKKKINSQMQAQTCVNAIETGYDNKCSSYLSVLLINIYMHRYEFFISSLFVVHFQCRTSWKQAYRNGSMFVSFSFLTRLGKKKPLLNLHIFFQGSFIKYNNIKKLKQSIY